MNDPPKGKKFQPVGEMVEIWPVNKVINAVKNKIEEMSTRSSFLFNESFSSQPRNATTSRKEDESSEDDNLSYRTPLQMSKFQKRSNEAIEAEVDLNKIACRLAKDEVKVDRDTIAVTVNQLVKDPNTTLIGIVGNLKDYLHCPKCFCTLRRPAGKPSGLLKCLNHGDLQSNKLYSQFPVKISIAYLGKINEQKRNELIKIIENVDGKEPKLGNGDNEWQTADRKGKGLMQQVLGKTRQAELTEYATPREAQQANVDGSLVKPNNFTNNPFNPTPTSFNKFGMLDNRCDYEKISKEEITQIRVNTTF